MSPRRLGNIGKQSRIEKSVRFPEIHFREVPDRLCFPMFPRRRCKSFGLQIDFWTFLNDSHGAAGDHLRTWCSQAVSLCSMRIGPVGFCGRHFALLSSVSDVFRSRKNYPGIVRQVAGNDHPSFFFGRFSWRHHVNVLGNTMDFSYIPFNQECV